MGRTDDKWVEKQEPLVLRAPDRNLVDESDAEAEYCTVCGYWTTEPERGWIANDAIEACICGVCQERGVL